MSTQISWVGDEDRPLGLCRPCSCGCDARHFGGQLPGVGYLTGSTPEGKGFSIWITNETVYQTLSELLPIEGGVGHRL